MLVEARMPAVRHVPPGMAARDLYVARRVMAERLGSAVAGEDPRSARVKGTILDKLNLPTGGEWKCYVLRHSLATIARNRGAEKWNLEDFMGNRWPSRPRSVQSANSAASRGRWSVSWGDRATRAGCFEPERHPSPVSDHSTPGRLMTG